MPSASRPRATSALGDVVGAAPAVDEVAFVLARVEVEEAVADPPGALEAVPEPEPMRRRGGHEL